MRSRQWTPSIPSDRKDRHDLCVTWEVLGVIQMHKLLLLCCATLVISSAALCQSTPASNVSAITDPIPAASPFPPAPQAVSRLDLTSWQLAFTYQFTQFLMPGETANHASVPDFTANDNGYGVSVTRFLNDWGGLEGDVDMSFGGTSTSVIKSSKFLFVGGGPHFALRGRGRVEPWGHVLVGLGHFRFSQTATVYGSNNSVAFIGGLGADFHLNPRTAFRVQGDYVGTALFKEPQTSWRVGAGIVFNF